MSRISEIKGDCICNCFPVYYEFTNFLNSAFEVVCSIQGSSGREGCGQERCMRVAWGNFPHLRSNNAFTIGFNSIVLATSVTLSTAYAINTCFYD